MDRGIRNPAPAAGIFATKGSGGEKAHIVKRILSSDDSLRSAAGWNARTSLVNLAVLNLPCKSGCARTCMRVRRVCVAPKYGSAKHHESESRSRGPVHRRAPVPASQFVTDEAIGNKQQGDSNCLSFSAVVHWMLSSR